MPIRHEPGCPGGRLQRIDGMLVCAYCRRGTAYQSALVGSPLPVAAHRVVKTERRGRARVGLLLEVRHYLTSRAWHRMRGYPMPPVPERLRRVRRAFEAVLIVALIVALGFMLGSTIANW